MSDFINTVDVIGDDALTDQIIDRTVTEVKDNVVASIRAYAFYGCAALKNADFPAVAGSLGSTAFQDCSDLEMVNAPLLTGIGSLAFKNCASLRKVNAPLATTIGNNAFNGCTAFDGTGLDFSKIKNLQYYALQGCNLKTVHLPVATTVGEGAFKDCKALESVSLPAVTSLGNGVFENCTSLVSSDSIELPNSITSLPTRTFQGAGLREANFPNIVTLQSDAFRGMPNLVSVNLPLVETMGDRCFYGCKNLTEVYMPKLTAVVTNGFYGTTSLKRLDLPKVTSIVGRAFSADGQAALETLILRSETMCTLDSTTSFVRTPIEKGTGYIYVPRALVDTYKADSVWSTYANQFRAIEDYPDVCG